MILRKKERSLIAVSAAIALAAMMLPALAMNPQIALATSHGDPIDPPGDGGEAGAGTPCNTIVALTAIQQQSNVQDAIAQDLRGPDLSHVVTGHGGNVAEAAETLPHFIQ